MGGDMGAVDQAALRPVAHPHLLGTLCHDRLGMVEVWGQEPQTPEAFVAAVNGWRLDESEGDTLILPPGYRFHTVGPA